MLHTALPWFESPVDFLTSTECMERETQSLDMFAQDDRSAQIFHVTRGSTAGPKDLPWLDAESAILIAVNRVPGDDVAIALDYRPNAADPAVVASDAWTNPPPHPLLAAGSTELQNLRRHPRDRVSLTRSRR